MCYPVVQWCWTDFNETLANWLANVKWSAQILLSSASKSMFGTKNVWLGFAVFIKLNIKNISFYHLLLSLLSTSWSYIAWLSETNYLTQLRPANPDRCCLRGGGHLVRSSRCLIENKMSKNWNDSVNTGWFHESSWDDCENVIKGFHTFKLRSFYIKVTFQR